MNRDYSNVSPAWGLITYYYSILFVGIYGNERADRFAKAATRRAHRAAARTVEERQEQEINALADSIVAAILNR